MMLCTMSFNKLFIYTILKSQTVCICKVFILQTGIKLGWAYGQFSDEENCIVVHRDVINLNLHVFAVGEEMLER